MGARRPHHFLIDNWLGIVAKRQTIDTEESDLSNNEGETFQDSEVEYIPNSMDERNEWDEESDNENGDKSDQESHESAGKEHSDDSMHVVVETIPEVQGSNYEQGVSPAEVEMDLVLDNKAGVETQGVATPALSSSPASSAEIVPHHRAVKRKATSAGPKGRSKVRKIQVDATKVCISV